jgi:NodT family efflux transporter outer membrane factor (OMF) lipoprotein
LFPTVGTSPGITASSGGRSSAQAGTIPGSVANTSAGAVSTSYSLPFSASWEPDLWGSIRRCIAEAAAGAQASAGDLENAKLLYQAELAEDYFELRGNESQARLLQQTEASYQQYLDLTRDRVNAGIATELEVAQAQTQLYGVQSQLIDLGVSRAEFEHAIAILTGKPPAELAVPAGMLAGTPPAVPVGVPSELLERRPDIAAAERRVAASNEQIGIAIAAFYPQLTLSGLIGLNSSSLASWFTWPARVWSVGPQLAETLFDAGRRRAVVAEDRAAYDATVAAYRQTVLTAFQQVEDNLAALRILENESAKQQETITAAGRSLDLSTDQYRAGTADYLTVISSQAALLNSQVGAVTVLTRRMTASVMLIQALGGGWTSSKLPDTKAVSAAVK